MPAIRRFLPGGPPKNRTNLPPVNRCCRPCQVAWHLKAGNRCWVCSEQGTPVTGLSQWVVTSMIVPNIQALP